MLTHLRLSGSLRRDRGHDRRPSWTDAQPDERGRSGLAWRCVAESLAGSARALAWGVAGRSCAPNWTLPLGLPARLAGDEPSGWHDRLSDEQPVFKSHRQDSGSGRRSLIPSIKAGEYVFREGDLGTEMYIIHEGKVEILKELEGEEQAARGAREGRLLRRDGDPRGPAAHRLGARRHRLDAAPDQRLDLRPDAARQPRDRGAHDAQAVAPPARDRRAAARRPGHQPRPSDVAGARSPRARCQAPAEARREAGPRQVGHGVPARRRARDHDRPQGPGHRHLSRHRPHARSTSSARSAAATPRSTAAAASSSSARRSAR